MSTRGGFLSEQEVRLGVPCTVRSHVGWGGGGSGDGDGMVKSNASWVIVPWSHYD